MIQKVSTRIKILQEGNGRGDKNNIDKGTSCSLQLKEV